MNNLYEYLNDLFVQAGVHPDHHETLLAEMEPILLTRIVTKLALKLPADQVSVAEKFLENWDHAGFWSLCEKYIPDYEGYFVETLEEFEDEYLHDMK